MEVVLLARLLRLERPAQLERYAHGLGRGSTELARLGDYLATLERRGVGVKWGRVRRPRRPAHRGDGFDNRPPSAAELDAMRAALGRSRRAPGG